MRVGPQIYYLALEMPTLVGMTGEGKVNRPNTHCMVAAIPPYRCVFNQA